MDSKIKKQVVLNLDINHFDQLSYELNNYYGYDKVEFKARKDRFKETLISGDGVDFKIIEDTGMDLVFSKNGVELYTINNQRWTYSRDIDYVIMTVDIDFFKHINKGDNKMIIIDNKKFVNFKADTYNGKIEVKKIDEANKNKEQIVVIVNRLFDFNCLPKDLDVNDVDAVFEINNTNDLFEMYKATNSLTDFKTIFIQEDLEDYIIQNIRNKTK